MSVSEVATRYAVALHSLAKEKGIEEKTLQELRALGDLFNKDKDIYDFIHSPLIVAASREAALKAALDGNGVSEDVSNFILMLARKNRIAAFEGILEAYQNQVDIENGVTRGIVRSVSVLSPEERVAIEKKISDVTGKRVILNYTEEPNLIGGLIAQVGSYTFDDTLTTHLSRLKEDLNRRTH
ncbi:MAG: ATP synthase F1 subunit delta [Bdellovibrionales bacterium]|nr:ATP synthase F1 subunit delta [Bdellovibrionales bacterium]